MFKESYSIKYRNKNASTGFVETFIDEFSISKPHSCEELEQKAKSIFGKSIDIVSIIKW